MLSPRGTPKSPTPRQDFNAHLKNERKAGKAVVSDKRKTSGRVVEFDDGSTLRLLKTGYMVHDRSDGSKEQRNPDGKGIKIEANGTKIQHNPNGNVVVQQMDGTTITHVATGEKIYVYPDGTTKQVDVDGTGILLNQAGERTDYGFGGDARFDADRLARDKGQLPESEENSASSDEGAAALKAETSSDDTSDVDSESSRSVMNSNSDGSDFEIIKRCLKCDDPKNRKCDLGCAIM